MRFIVRLPKFLDEHSSGVNNIDVSDVLKHSPIILTKKKLFAFSVPPTLRTKHYLT